MSDYVMTFLAMEIGNIIIVSFLAYSMTMNIGTVDQIRHFRRMQMFYVMQCAAQLFWVADSSGIIHLPIWLSWLVNMLYGVSFGLAMYQWFLFIASKMRSQAPEGLLRVTRVLQKIVAVVHVALYCTSIWTKWMFLVDEQGRYVRGSMFWLNRAACYSHWVMATLILFFCLRGASQVETTRIRRLLIISLIPVLGGILQNRFYNIPFADTAMVLSMVCLFTYLQESQIRSDALTGLNNRSQFNIAFEQRMSRVNTEPFLLFVADVDHFKKINDTYGHLMGDRVLMLIANGLKKLGGVYHSLGIYRYGGDEFVLLIRERELSNVEDFCEEINQILLDEMRSAGLGFSVQCSLGYSLVSSAADGARAFKAADDMLYARKRR